MQFKICLLIQKLRRCLLRLFRKRRSEQGRQLPLPHQLIMGFDLLDRRRDKFVLWIPGVAPESTLPELVLGTLDDGPPATFTKLFSGPLATSDQPDLFELDPATIQPPLKNNTRYHYWFVIQDTSPENLGEWQITDPITYTVDYRLTNSRDDHVQPASVIKFRDGKLWPCDIDGVEPSHVTLPPQEDLPDNNHMVIYELPASWAKFQQVGDVQVDIGTFTDVLALFDSQVTGQNFAGIQQVADNAILSELGINALELLPAADAKPQGEWGYATAHYFAPDYDLGTSSSLARLVETIHGQKTRFFTDVVMAFGRDPYVYAAFKQFHINPPDEPFNADSWQSHRSGQIRDGFGSRPWRYIQSTNTYDPESGVPNTKVHPSWAFHHAHLTRWMATFGVDGLRLDSINNIANYDFLKCYKELAWKLYHDRYPAGQSSNAKFLVIGEELNVPLDLITSGTLNALWNEPWQTRLRSLIIGEQGTMGDNFEYTVLKLINCTTDSNYPFTDGSQAINYITSHDVEGTRKERLYNYLKNCGIGDEEGDLERRAKFAFALQFMSVGIPMIFAGEEFCDQMDRPIGEKQMDPVNYGRKSDPWRTSIFDYVTNLVKFRKSCPALGDDDTEVIQVDGNVVAWVRGGSESEKVVVVANFSGVDREGDNSSGVEEYVVNGWPEKEVGGWWEVTQQREVPDEWVGREPLMGWEVKVYTRWRYPA